MNFHTWVQEILFVETNLESALGKNPDFYPNLSKAAAPENGFVGEKARTRTWDDCNEVYDRVCLYLVLSGHLSFFHP